MRKNRSKTRSVYSGAIPTPRSVTAIWTWPSRPATADRHLGPGRRVADRVVDEIGQRGHQQGSVASHEQPGTVVADHPDPGAFRRGRNPGNRLVDNGVDLDNSEIGQRIRALQPGQRDEFIHQCAQPDRLRLQLPGEPADLFGIVGGIHRRFGQQAHGGHRRLQFVRHIGDEIAPCRFHPLRGGFVGGGDEDAIGSDQLNDGDHGGRRSRRGQRRAVADLLDIDLDAFAGHRTTAGRGDDPSIDDAGVQDTQITGAVVVEQRAAGRIHHQVAGAGVAAAPPPRAVRRSPATASSTGPRDGPPGSTRASREQRRPERRRRTPDSTHRDGRSARSTNGNSPPPAPGKPHKAAGVFIQRSPGGHLQAVTGPGSPRL